VTVINGGSGYSSAPTISFSGGQLVTTLNVPRYDHTATLLDNGSVLIAGGVTSSDILNTNQSKLFVIGSAELYQPLTQAGPSSITVTPNGAQGSAAITPTNKGMVTGGTSVVINASPGPQTDPHVSQNTASYTDGPSGQVRYYNFATSTDLGISNVMASGEVAFDNLSDVYSTSIAFTRSSSIGSDIVLFDTVARTLTTIDPTTAPIRQTPAIGNNTIAYIDLGFPGGAAGELVVHDIAANTSTRLTNDAVVDQSPHVSPNGQVVVWQSFNGTSYDVKQAVLNGTSWTVSNVTSASDSENNPDTDGTYIVYDSNRATSNSGSDIYFRLVSGPEMQLAVPGVQTQPRVASGIIAFLSSPDGVQPNDLFLYRISSNELFQVTNTPTVSEVLNDATVLPNGDVRLVWSTAGSEADVLATTFTLPPPANPAIPVGTTQHFIAADPNTGQQLASVIWSSSDNTVVTISNDAGNSGTALAVGPGTATIQACVGTVCGSATLIVN
jgi:hypothetical protein